MGPMSDDMDISEVPRTVRAMLNVAMDILDKKEGMMKDKNMMYEEGNMEKKKEKTSEEEVEPEEEPEEEE